MESYLTPSTVRCTPRADTQQRDNLTGTRAVSEPITRIPLTIVAPLGKTDGVIVAVMVTDLDALEAENDRLRAVLTEAREELARWGWGDMHYGATPQEFSVVNMLAKIDTALYGGPLKAADAPIGPD